MKITGASIYKKADKNKSPTPATNEKQKHKSKLTKYPKVCDTTGVGCWRVELKKMSSSCLVRGVEGDVFVV